MDIYNEIAQISLKHFSNLPKTGKPTEKEWTVLSTIVVETKTNTFEVVALGTGTKCIGKSQMSAHGNILNDSHAEIICRRSFLKYLYYEMKRCVINNNTSAILDFCNKTKKFSIKSHINFHFFTTHVPCGDAAIFPKENMEDPGQAIINRKRHNEDTGEDIEKRMKIEYENNADIYRTGAKCLSHGENQDPHEDGTNFHVIGAIRTKPGRGDPTLSVSCSDKIAKWCYLGVQGSLLSLYLEKPLYLKSFTLAGKTPYSNDALKRAYDKRFEDVMLPEPFRKHSILIHQSDYPFEYEKSAEKLLCPSSISWWKGIRKSEAAINGRKQGITKKRKNSKDSRLGICKIELMRDFVEISQVLQLNHIPESVQYNEIKALSTKYQDGWNIVKKDIFKAYTCKDPMLLHFRLD